MAKQDNQGRAVAPSTRNQADEAEKGSHWAPKKPRLARDERPAGAGSAARRKAIGRLRAT